MANAYISAKVVATYDLGTHTLFIADVTDAEILSKIPSVTYTYYHQNIKPKPEQTKVKGWRCKIADIFMRERNFQMTLYVEFVSMEQQILNVLNKIDSLTSMF